MTSLQTHIFCAPCLWIGSKLLVHGVNTLSGCRPSFVSGPAWPLPTAQAYVPKVSMRQEVANDIRHVFNARHRAEADMRLNEGIEKYAKSAPSLAQWMENAIPEGLTIFSLPEAFRKRLRTSNMCETLNTQIKRRTKVAGLFPNEASILRLVSAILMDISEEWESGKTYLPQIETH